ncbi:MAG TPA: PspA/IM30 family protein [Acidimicrobiales bacterium]|nr:PspA/IM30 family protein [Acidimicrobiales bacterium]
MAFWQRLANIFRAKTNKLLDRVEDPRDTLDLSYEKQVENLQKVRRSVAEVATARKRIELQAKQLRQQADKLQGQARAALGQKNEDLAREALRRRAAAGTEMEELGRQHDQIVVQETKLVETSQRLQAQVEAFRTRKETMKASYTAAEAQSRIGEAVSGISESALDAGMAMQRAEDKIADMQARAGAVDELLESGALTDLTSTRDDIQMQLDKMAASSQVESELVRLRGELITSSAGELSSGDRSNEGPIRSEGAGTASGPATDSAVSGPAPSDSDQSQPHSQDPQQGSEVSEQMKKSEVNN